MSTADTRAADPRELTPVGERIELHSGGARATIGTVGAVLAQFEVDGVWLTEPIPADAAPELCNGLVLVPWPNRVRDGRWTHGDATLQLDITEPERNTALHGLLQFTDYEVRERTDAAVTLAASVPPQHGWPFFLDTWVRYELRGHGLRVTHGVTNRSTERAPWAVGSHPYLRIGSTPTEQLRLTVPAAEFYEVDERLNPTGIASVDGTPSDLRETKVIGDLDLDTAYRGLSPVDGASAWLESPDGARLELLQDADWDYVQVFTATPWMPVGGFPKTDRGGERGWAVAVEPMTAPPDALNSGEALIWVEPGGEWSGSWGLRYTPATAGR